jgi:hypothetical protein
MPYRLESLECCRKYCEDLPGNIEAGHDPKRDSELLINFEDARERGSDIPEAVVGVKYNQACF